MFCFSDVFRHRQLLVGAENWPRLLSTEQCCGITAVAEASTAWCSWPAPAASICAATVTVAAKPGGGTNLDLHLGRLGLTHPPPTAVPLVVDRPGHEVAPR